MFRRRAGQCGGRDRRCLHHAGCQLGRSTACRGHTDAGGPGGAVASGAHRDLLATYPLADLRHVRTAATVGVLIGAQVFIALDEGVISVALGGLLLLLVWGVPKGIKLTLPHRFLYVGGLHGFFGTLFGVGLFLQPAMLRTPLNRLQITGTLAMCLVVLEGMKAASYVGVRIRLHRLLAPHPRRRGCQGSSGTSPDTVFRAAFRNVTSAPCSNWW